mmetsp:Transcript_8267/g.11803  ORF Transcript_8267/g.11803 Transcript_8267/m.11803 type:complete len:129 (+) Transcript_8267:104-490(+)|eukprot:CAMPEP_0184862700 /NCGR_PEP_ID=MMETSP0580-20130426/7109_1 /TAXON_ID=1118495 /ORGANISM="Dactyliosolen fragilissimus" /LENGTH=128 /DNA_ID=CAMNT_0027360657 /DNA_START=56 /DNA_END=442 /DNA_ORIENTATION=-
MRVSTILLGLAINATASAFTLLKPLSTSNSCTQLFMSEGKHTGTVKWFDCEKGFGFILPDDGSTDVFVHQTSIQKEGFRSLRDGESVEYTSEVDDSNRIKTTLVTGPGGVDVLGAEPKFNESFDYDEY